MNNEFHSKINFHVSVFNAVCLFIDENLPDLSGIPIFYLPDFLFLLDMVTITLVVT